MGASLRAVSPIGFAIEYAAGMKEFDGQKQRSALTAAEQALRALASGQSEKARQSAAKAADLDQVGLYGGFVAVLEPLAKRLDAGVQVDDAGWDSLASSLGMGPLAALIDELRD